ncbi:MAG: PGF-pre-PGF domain-containing protein [bacterium]
MFNISYGHTSHGSQIVTGMQMLSSQNSTYTYTTGSLGFLCDMCISGDLGNPNRTAWAAVTRTHLNGAGAKRHVIMWSWCGQVDGTESDINLYLNLMNQLEKDYPNVIFIYMTGHLTGTGPTGNLYARNNQIRNYALANNKILFDFADIESYNPDGTYYPTESDACNWCSTWCSTHTCPSCGSCAHSHCFNCYNKGKAFWYMMARLAGWNGVSGGNTIIDTTPPTATITQPTANQQFPAGTTSTMLSVTTNEAATCRYSITQGTGYASMTNTFSTTGSTSHSTTITGLTNGQNYNYYVRCNDTAGNLNSIDYVISFGVTGSIISSDEPVDPGSNYVWQDNFDRYASLIAMSSDGNCAQGTDGYGIPSAQSTYGQRTQWNSQNGCVLQSEYGLITGRSGSGKAISSFIHADPNHIQQSVSWLSPWGWNGAPWGLNSTFSAFNYTGRGLVFQFWFRTSPGGTPGTYGTKWFEVWNTEDSRMQTGLHQGTDARPLWTFSNAGPVTGGINRMSQPVGPWWDNVNDGAWHRFTFLYRVNTWSTFQNGIRGTGGNGWFTRSSGTWLPNSQVGKIVRTGTSPGSGNAYYSITTNDATTLYFSGDASGSTWAAGEPNSYAQDGMYEGTSSRDGRLAVWVDGKKIMDFSQDTVGVTPPGGANVWALQADIDSIMPRTFTNLKFPDVFNGAPVTWSLDHDDLKVWTDNTAQLADTFSPVVTMTAPTANQQFPAGTTSTTLSVTTNEAATCKYSTSDQIYDNMPNIFSTTGSTSHSTTISGLQNSQTYNYYIRCNDTSGNKNSASSTISFSVNAPSIFCGDNICNGAETSTSCLADCPLPACDLTSATWSKTNAVEGESVYLNVLGTNCNGKTISFEIKEKDFASDLLGNDDPVTINPINVTFGANGAVGNWTTEWQDDGLAGIAGDPEYYFTATVVGSSESVQSGTSNIELLSVNKKITDVTGNVTCEANISAGKKCLYVAPDGNDNNNGSINAPFKTITKGLQTVNNGDTLFIRQGTYRMIDESIRGSSIGKIGATTNNHITIQNYLGERAIILGSKNTSGQTWTKYNNTIWSLDAKFLPSPPRGMFISSHRVPHKGIWFSDAIQHSYANNLTQDTWTIATATGTPCPENNHTGCFVYYWPPTGEDPNSNIYEFQQRDFLYASGYADYLVVRGLEIYYTGRDINGGETAAIFIEGGDNVLIENNIIGHYSSGMGNAYALGVWAAGGAVIRNNTIFDSQLWGDGSSNSHAISFMVSDPNNPHIVEYNTISNPTGLTVSTKGGVSGLIVRYNHLKDASKCVVTSGKRCIWTNPACKPGDSEYKPGGGWQIYGNIIENCSRGIDLLTDPDNNNNKIYNNIFINDTTGIYIRYNITTNTSIMNNIFINNNASIYTGGYETTRNLTEIFSQYTSDYNLFWNNQRDYFHRLNWGGEIWVGTAYTLAQMQSIYNREQRSISKNPLFTDTVSYALQASSPAIGTANAAVWGKTIADIGKWPNPRGTSTTPITPNNQSESTTSAGTTSAGSSGDVSVGSNIIFTEKKNSGILNISKRLLFTNFSNKTGIKEIVIEINNNITDLSNIPLTVSQYEAQPAEIPITKQGKVYKYLLIDAEDSGNRINSTNISFGVEKIWAEANSLEKNKIALFKFFPDESKWTQLNTVYNSADNNYYYYTSQLDSFSYFVVGEAETPIEEVQTPADATSTGSENLKFGQGIIFLIIELVLIIGIIITLIILIIKRKEYSNTKSQA